MSKYTGKRFVVTGGAGFIGSHLVDALFKRGAARVAVVDTFFLGKDANLQDANAAFGDALHVYREDAADLGAMVAICRAEEPDAVFNLATKALLYSFFNPPGACRVNVEIALTLGELLRGGFFEKLVHLSSSEVYGTARYVPMDENHPLLAETTYAAGKGAADLILASYANMFGVDVAILRPFNNYGPRQNDGDLAAVIPLTVRRIQRGERPVIHGDGEQTRDFIYVADTINAILDLEADAEEGVLNIGSGRETTILSIVKTICEIMDYSGDIHFDEARAADVRRHCADVTKASRLTPALAPTDLRKGLQKTVAWYLEGAA